MKHLIFTLFCLISHLAISQTTVTYTYDNNNRIITAQYGDGKTVSYTYDQVGNRSTTVVTTTCTKPVAVATGGTVCVSATIALSASGGLSYSWAGPAGFASTAQNPNISNATSSHAGTYTVTVSNGPTCTATATTTVSVNPAPIPLISGATTYCLNEFITLTATGGNSYTWSGPAGFTMTTAAISRAATTTVAGTYAVTVGNGTCTASTSVSVVVNSSLAISILGASTYCVGQPINLTATGGSSYSWSGPGGFASAAAAISRIAATNTAGIYSVTVANGTCSASTSVNVLVNPSLNILISGNLSYCVGQSINLTASGGSSYSWSGPGGFTMTTAAISRAGATTAMGGNYTVSASNGSGCTATATAAILISETTPGAIWDMNTTTIYKGNSIQFQSTATNNPDAYSWTFPGGTPSGSSDASPLVTYYTPGTYNVTFQAHNACGWRSKTIDNLIKVNDCSPPSVGWNSSSNTVNEGGTIQFQAVATNNTDAYIWTFPGGTPSSSTSATPSIKYNTPGTYNVTLQAHNSCGWGQVNTWENIITVNVCPTPSSSWGASASTINVGGTVQFQSNARNNPDLYNWTFPGGTPSSLLNSTNPSPVVQYNTPGVYSVTFQAHNACGWGYAGTANNIITVNACSPPTPNFSGNNNLCTGQVMNLTATGGSVYSWYGPGGFTSNNATISRAATSDIAGVYSLIVGNGVCTASLSLNVVVNTTPTASINGIRYVCVGTPLSVTACCGSLYQWSGPNGFSSSSATITFPGTSPMDGDYSVKVYNNSSSCSATSSARLKVWQYPTASISGKTTYCVGEMINLTAYDGGTSLPWYAWSGPNGFTSNLANISLSATTSVPGIYMVTAYSGSSCTSTASISVVVNINPNLVASANTPACVGKTLQLSAASNGTSFSWSGPSLFSSTQQSPTRTNASAVMSGIYSVTAAVNGCTNTATVPVSVVSASVTASNSGPVCLGQTVNLSAVATNALGYSWIGPSGFSSTQQNPVSQNVTTNSGGRYSVSAFYGGCTATATTSVSVKNGITLTVSSNSPVCAGKTLNLSSTITGGSGLSYKWAGPSGFTSTIRNPQIAKVATANSGIYTITGSATSISCSASATTAVVINCAGREGIPEEDNDPNLDVIISPNPGTENVRVQIFLQKPSSIKLQVVDAVGITKKEWFFEEKATFHERILDISHYPEGFYLLVTQTEDGVVISKKFYKRR